MSHTPGPWKVGADSGWAPWSDSIEVAADRESVCFTAGINAETQKANARLIAAAPDLLAIAKECLELAKLASDLTGGRGDDDYVFGIEDRLTAAIAKAEGTPNA